MRKLKFLDTLWCGPGTKAKKYEDLGKAELLDRCCRDHDKCDDSIEAGKTKHGIYNDQGFTM